MITWRSHPILSPPTDEEMAAMEPDDLVQLHSIYHAAIENAQKDPYRFGFRLPHWKKAEEQLAGVSEVLALGGNRSGKTQWGFRLDVFPTLILPHVHRLAALHELRLIGWQNLAGIRRNLAGKIRLAAGFRR